MAISRSEPLLGLCAVLVPCAFGPWLKDSYVLPKLAAASALACASALRALVRRRLPPGSELDWPIAAFCAVAALSAALSLDPRMSFFGSYQDYLFGVFGIAGCVAGFYAGRGQAPEELLRWIVAGSLPVSAYALWQWIGLVASGGEGRDRILSTFGSPVYLGAYLALVLPLALYLWRSAQGEWSRLGLAAGALALPALAVTESRGAWLGAAVGLLALGSMDLPARRAKFVLLAVFAALLALLALGRLRRPSADVRGADSARMETWRIAWQEFRERPWLGSGPDAFVIGFRRLKSERLSRIYSLHDAQTQAHNDWLQVMATMGLAGLAAYAWLHGALLKAAAGVLRRSRGPVAAAFAALLAVFVQAKFNSPSFFVMFLAAALCGSALASSRTRKGGDSLGPAPVLFALAVLWSTSCSARAVAADRQDRLGSAARREGRLKDAAGHLERAVALAPENTSYRYDLANLLWDAASGIEKPGRELLLLRAVQLAAGGLRLRPLDADLHRLLGLAELRLAEDGERERLKRAQRALELSAALDPTFVYTLQDLLRTAELEGDEAMRRDVEIRLKRLRGEPL